MHKLINKYVIKCNLKNILKWTKLLYKLIDYNIIMPDIYKNQLKNLFKKHFRTSYKI